MTTTKVHCNCSAVSIEVTGPLRPVIACHCRECRKQSGYVFAATAALDDNMSVTGGDNITWYSHSVSSKRGFCSICGCYMLFKDAGRQDTAIAAGLFDPPDDIPLESQIYISEKPPTIPLFPDRRSFEKESDDRFSVPEPEWRARITAAADRIRPYIRRTPVMDVDGSDFGLKGTVSLKLELFQVTGSFKPRGAFNTLLSSDVPDAGVTAASGGNHGAAVAYAAKTLGITATIFVPEISSPSKQKKIASYGASLRVGGAEYAESLMACETFQAETGAMSIHAYDAEKTIAGQGTVAKEWLEQSPGLDTLLVAVGGGGLVSGIAAWCQNSVKVVAVEPEGASALSQALEAGAPTNVSVRSVAADSLGARRIGDLNYPIARKYVASSVTVPDSAVTETQHHLWQKYGVAAEPGGATALAALLSGAYKPDPGERVGVLVCGSNVSLSTLETSDEKARN